MAAENKLVCFDINSNARVNKVFEEVLEGFEDEINKVVFHDGSLLCCDDSGIITVIDLKSKKSKKIHKKNISVCFVFLSFII